MSNEHYYTDSKKLTAFIIGASAHIARLEKLLGLPPIDASEYKKYSHKGGSSGAFTDDAIKTGEFIETYEGGFFGFINDIFKPVIDTVKSVVKPITDHVMPVLKPVLSNPITKAFIGNVVPGGDMINTGLSALGMGNQTTGGDYIINKGSAYVIEKNGGSNINQADAQLALRQRTIDGQIYAPDRVAIHDGDRYKIGAIYKIRGKNYLYTADKGFIAPIGRDTVKGSAYLDENGKIVVASHGLLGSTNKSNSSKTMTPSDFTQ